MNYSTKNTQTQNLIPGNLTFSNISRLSKSYFIILKVHNSYSISLYYLLLSQHICFSYRIVLPSQLYHRSSRLLDPTPLRASQRTHSTNTLRAARKPDEMRGAQKVFVKGDRKEVYIVKVFAKVFAEVYIFDYLNVQLYI